MFNENVSETYAAFMCEKDAWNDRVEFVHNLGCLMSQMRDGVLEAYLSKDDVVHVIYKGGHEETVNVRLDSYAAIVRDVMKAVR